MGRVIISAALTKAFIERKDEADQAAKDLEKVKKEILKQLKEGDSAVLGGGEIQWNDGKTKISVPASELASLLKVFEKARVKGIDFDLADYVEGSVPEANIDGLIVFFEECRRKGLRVQEDKYIKESESKGGHRFDPIKKIKDF